jgi:hypothetical protein
MELNKFLSLLAAFFGLIGSIFLAKGVLLQSPESILGLTSPHSRIGFAPEQIASMAGQKADALVGIFLIFLAFTTQLLVMIFISENIGFTKNRWIGTLLAVSTALVITIICFLANIGYKEHMKFEIGKLDIRIHFAERLKEKIGTHDLKSLEVRSEILLRIKGANQKVIWNSCTE